MISLFLLAFAGAPAAAPSPAVMDRNRAAYRACLATASASAKPPAVTADKFAAYIHAQCAAQEAALTDAMVSWDMRNGASRKSAADGASMAVQDFLETAKSNWSARNP
ncbi:MULTISPECIES: hypothetical protein [Sphingomonas]|uniref:hypothetical protein n=1 Tax=Sphingomonas TaxID=13687 RepID=UPI000DEFA62D|nr:MULTISPECIES: hypothetical protein [Sphingomonas]